MMIGIFGYGITMILFGLATELWMLFVFRALSGILSSATSPTTMAYISDSTSEKDRSGGMGMLGAAAGLGTILGPGLGGWLAGESLSLPFFIAGGMSFLTLILIALFLPESLPKEARQSSQGLVKSLQPRQWIEALHSPVGILLWMAFLASLTMTAFYAIFGLYALEKYAYGPQQVGTILMIIGLISAIAQGALTGPLTRRVGEAPVIKASLLVTAVGFLTMILVKTYVLILVSIGVFALGAALFTPAVTALTSKRTTLEQGLTMGLSNAFMSLGRIFGPLGAGLLFDKNLNYPYIAGAAISLVGFGVALVYLSEGRKPSVTQPAH
jgi:DHA1 family multidrug resistance protein-like MFS transporter